MKFQLTREFAYLEQSKTADFIIHRSFHYFHVLSISVTRAFSTINSKRSLGSHVKRESSSVPTRAEVKFSPNLVEANHRQTGGRAWLTTIARDV